ncbi:MAG: serine hydrolase [Bacteriovoracaceae bacterium]
MLSNNKKLKPTYLLFLAFSLGFIGCKSTPKHVKHLKLSETFCQDVLGKDSEKTFTESRYKRLFSEDYRNHLSYSKMQATSQGLKELFGYCLKVEDVTTQGAITILTSQNKKVQLTLTTDGNAKSITSFNYHRHSEADNSLMKKANFICSQIKANPSFNYEEHFGENFRKAIPKSRLVGILKSLHKQYGNCKQIEKEKDELVKEFYTEHKNEKKLHFNIALENEGQRPLISSLLYRGEKLQIKELKSARDIKNELKKISGKTSLLLMDENEKVIIKHNHEAITPLGSVFKLFVLEALAEEIKQGRISWDDQIKIENSFKSLPSGIMQNYKKGKKVTVFDAAEKMLSISDNTATDHLIELIGKRKIEKHIAGLPFVKNKQGLTPFLKTRELFLVRAFWDEQTTSAYAKSSATKRRMMLANLKTKISNKSLMDKLSTWSSPRSIYDIEWFSTPLEVCQLLVHLNKRNNEKINQVLSPNSSQNEDVPYVAYKGGSEPGVLQQSYLIKNKNKPAQCLYVGNTKKDSKIVQNEVLGFSQSVLKWALKN